MCCPFSVSIVKRVSAKADRNTCGGLWEGLPQTLLAGLTAGTLGLVPRLTSPIANSRFDVSGAFEDTSFASLAELVSENTLKGVKEMGFEHMTEIQHKSIRPLLEGR